MLWYTVLVAAVAVERLIELVIAKRNLAWSLQRGGKQYGAGHYSAMVVLHSALLIGCLAEVALTNVPFIPVLGATMLALLVASQALRWWCIATLGHRWNTRIVVVADLPLVTGGPYRWLRHPNYVAVVVEGFALPLVHTAWITAVIFTMLNVLLLRVRIRAEDSALAAAIAS